MIEILAGPNPSLADRIEYICEGLMVSDWYGLIPMLWPTAKYVYSIMTGSMQHYLTKLRHYAGGLALVSGDYGSTESWIGVNVEPTMPPENVSFAVVPTFSYFEFIPLFGPTNGNDNWTDRSIDCNTKVVNVKEGEPVTLSQVKEGQEYEVVLTTFTGKFQSFPFSLGVYDFDIYFYICKVQHKIFTLGYLHPKLSKV